MQWTSPLPFVYLLFLLLPFFRGQNGMYNIAALAFCKTQYFLLLSSFLSSFPSFLLPFLTSFLLSLVCPLDNSPLAGGTLKKHALKS